MPITFDNYLTDATVQIVNLFLTNSFFAETVRPGNIIKSLSGIRWPAKPNKASGDLPSFDIWISRNNVQNANVMATFTNVKSGACDRNVWKDVHFALLFIFDGVDRKVPNQIQSIIEGLLLQNPTLGITTVPVKSSGKFTCDIKEERSVRTQNILRLVLSINLPVIFLLDQAALIAQGNFTGAP